MFNPKKRILINKRQDLLDRFEELKKNHNDLMEVISDGILTINSKGNVISCNDSYLYLTGFKRSEIIGKNITNIPTLRIKDVPKYLKIFASFLKNKKIGKGEFIWKDSKKRKRYGEYAGYGIKRQDKIVALRLILKDTTEKVEQESKIKLKNKELEKRNRDLETFHKMVIQREQKMIELKKEIKDLKSEINR